MAIILNEVEAGSARDAELLALRTRVLRTPLGLDYTPEQLAEEKDQIRLAILVDRKMAACMLLAPLDATTIKLRQMAVDGHHQGTGLGLTLIHYGESYARRHQFKTIELHARETAIGFYEKAGYVLTGEPFEEVTLVHCKMLKQL